MAGEDAFGTTLSLDGVTIAEVTALSPIGASAEVIDVTSHQSPEGWREKIGGLKDAGELSADVNWTPANHGDLFDSLAVTGPLVITFPPAADDATLTGEGFLSGLEITANHDDKLEGSLTITWSGKPVLDIPA